MGGCCPASACQAVKEDRNSSPAGHQGIHRLHCCGPVLADLGEAPGPHRGWTARCTRFMPAAVDAGSTVVSAEITSCGLPALNNASPALAFPLFPYAQEPEAVPSRPRVIIWHHAVTFLLLQIPLRHPQLGRYTCMVRAACVQRAASHAGSMPLRQASALQTRDCDSIGQLLHETLATCRSHPPQIPLPLCRMA